MAVPQQMTPQTDFSAGQLNADLKRGDNPIVKSGVRQLTNWRLLNSGRPQQRPGRRALFVLGSKGRVDQVRVLPGVTYYIEFGGDGSLNIYNSAGGQVAHNGLGPFGWRTATVHLVVWSLVRTSGTTSDIVICFDGEPPVVAHFDGIATWTFPFFSFQVDGTGIPLCPYFRVAPLGVTIQASNDVGAVSLTASSAVFTASHTNAQIRLANRRLSITSYVSPTLVNATWLEVANPVQQIDLVAADGYAGVGIGGFRVGLLVQGDSSTAQGEIVGIAGSSVFVQSLNSQAGFVAGELLLSAAGKAKINAVTNSTQRAMLTWDEQMVSDARGWPRSCSSDQGRLIFTDLPSTPEAIIWGAVDQTYDFNVGAQPTDAIIELIAGKPRVYHVVGGLQETVFTDKGIYYIPITEANPLKPGSVVFRLISPDAASQIRPVETNEAILYINAGLKRVVAVAARGDVNSTRPYFMKDASEYHYDLFHQPKGIAVASGEGTFPERYIYVVNGDGTLVVGRFEPNNDKNWVGWLPWSGTGSVNWVSSLQSNVIFTTNYPANQNIVEAIDDTVYLDGAVAINAVPTGMAAPVGQGPMWWAVVGVGAATVDLMDGVRPLGTHAVDNLGFIVPFEGEDLSSATIIAGFPWTQLLEPFVPLTAAGQNMHQRVMKRRIARAAVSIEHATGFAWVKLYSGPSGANLPTPGTMTIARRVPNYNEGDDATLPPPLREVTDGLRPLGRANDPRIGIYKDTPGPILVLEVGMEVSI